MVLGGLMLVDTAEPAFGIPPWVVVSLAATSAAVVFLVGGMALRARARPPSTGGEILVGQRARVLDATGHEAWVELRGERWRAMAEHDLHAGQSVRVTAVEGLTLLVAPA
jgi:membrane-bound serine protease (ClpP class)